MSAKLTLKLPASGVVCRLELGLKLSLVADRGSYHASDGECRTAAKAAGGRQDDLQTEHGS